jgi:hypothetical protein
MRFITGLIFIVNILAWVIGLIVAFSSEPLMVGLPVTIGFIGFVIAWRVSGGVAVSAADFFFQPEWDVFKKKLKWANGTGFTIALFSTLIPYILAEL